jgi:DNA-binding SARP family transcriptional activator
MSEPGDSTLRFELLGALRAWRGEMGVNLGPVQQRVVLAVLLLQQNRPIGRQQLVEAVWGEEEPRYAANLLHRHISGLRRALGLAPGRTGQLARSGRPVPSGEPGWDSRVAPGRVVWTDGGYLLTVPSGCLDLEVFGKELIRAREARAEGELSAAAEILRSALELWRGPPCAGLTSPFLDAERDRLDEWRSSVVEERLELDLAIGRRPDVITELRHLVAEHPLREKLHGLLMLALYRSGRRAEALAAFQEARQVLREELGVDPAAPLQRLHQQILNADPELIQSGQADVPPSDSAVVSHAIPVPAQLPHSVAGFSNREAEIDWLNRLLSSHDPEASGTVPIVAIGGTAGVGKTALVLHWAHQIRGRFPDGQLYVNMRGFDPNGPSMEPREAISAFLDAFAVPPGRFPVDLDAQAALYRTILAGRRVLIVLDNARDADQVRPLLPGTPSCLVLVTSRNQLLSLIATDGAHPLVPDLLSPEQARHLLVGRLGLHLISAEPAAVDEIINACAGLPLALSIVSARVAANPRLTLAELADELRETRGRLHALEGGDSRTDLRAVFSWSYQALSPQAARLFRLLGMHAGPDIGILAAASLAGQPQEQVRVLLGELTRAHLLDDQGRGRYGFHDLLHAYAAELADKDESAQDRRQAIQRVLDYYLRTAYRADELLRPNRDDAIVLTLPVPLVTPHDPGDHQRAMAWFTTEYQVLLSALRQAVANGFDVHAWQLAWALQSFFDRRGHWHEAATAQRIALAAADRLGDPYAQAKSRGCFAYAYIRLGRYREALAHLVEALELYKKLGDRLGQAHIHRSLTWVLDRQGNYQEALPHAEQAMELFMATGHRAGQARALNAAGWFHVHLGDPEKGLRCCQQSLQMQKEMGDRFGQADTLDSIASAYRDLGDFQRAIDFYHQALHLYREFGDRYYEADTLACLGDTHFAYGDPASAEAAWRSARTILDELGHPQAGQVKEKLEGLTGTASLVNLAGPGEPPLKSGHQ